MICPRCGTINPDDAERCTRCRGSLAPPPPREKVDTAAEMRPATREEPAGGPEGRDAILPTPTPTPAAGPAGSALPPPETPTWPPPWPPPPTQPAPPTQSGPWGPPPGLPPQPGQWGPPPAVGQWPPPAPPAPGQWPPPGPPLPGPSSASANLRRTRGDRPNYLPWAVLCTILFNLIGIVAVVYCVVANRRFAAGDVDGGMHATQLAKTWCWISVVVGLFGLLLIAGGVVHLPTTGG